MDLMTWIAVIAGFVTIVAGIVAVVDYLQRRLPAKKSANIKKPGLEALLSEERTAEAAGAEVEVHAKRERGTAERQTPEQRQEQLSGPVQATVQIFLSYVREDEEKVRSLYQKLSDAGFRPWMDKKDILPGEIWESSIQRAIRHSDFFLACLSANSVTQRGFLQREIREALAIWQEMLESDIYLIPVRLEDCEVPEGLRGFQWVNLFEEDGWTQLVKAIQVGT